MYKKALVLLRKDLRLMDNTALIQATKLAKEVILGFCFDPRQADKDQNPYFSINGFQFLLESLADLQKEAGKLGTKIHIWHGPVHEVIEQLVKNGDIDSLHINADYTPFSRKRDTELQTIMKKHDGGFYASHDCLLTIPGSIVSGNKTPYKVFTPFWKTARKQIVPDPAPLPKKITWGSIPENKFSVSLSEFSQKFSKNRNIAAHGGRSVGLKKLGEKIEELTTYKEERDFPALGKTSVLSAYIKFGCISIREVFWAFGAKHGLDHGLLQELYWRDFYYHVVWSWPEVFGLEFQEKYRDVIWKQNKETFQQWCDGKTGFPIVDAGMRELNETGFMHNRVRMIVASFLVKDLHLDWRLGERYFAQQLTDYDPCVNNGSWQWAASTGCDAQPYFRIFNPWRQLERFDPECEYIKQWIPELRDLTPKEIKKLEKQRPLSIGDYPEPMVEHKKSAEVANMMFQV